jgi:hypothetical protein
MYLVASDNNPFDTANFGTIRSYAITPEVAAWEKYTLMAALTLLLLIL